MRIEKLNENKIRIFLNLQDLEEKNIDLHTFMSTSIESQDLFLDMLNQAETELGFKTHNHKLVIEALASSDGDFILTITKLGSQPSQASKVAKPKVKRKSVTINKILSLYKFASFDEFCDFCDFINKETNDTYISKLKTASLVLYNDNYYLIINKLRLNILEAKRLSCILSEFASRIRNEELLERKIKEYGKVIIPKNAISTCLEYFCK